MKHRTLARIGREAGHVPQGEPLSPEAEFLLCAYSVVVITFDSQAIHSRFRAGQNKVFSYY